jgi:hypothetical protein
MLPKDQIDQAKQRAQRRNASNIKEEADGEMMKLTMTYPDDPNVVGTWDKKIAAGGVEYDAKGNVKKAG